MTTYPTVNAAKINPIILCNPQELASLYLMGEHVMPTQWEIDQFRVWIFREFHRHALANVLWVTDDDVTPERMLSSWENNSSLVVSAAHSDHPFLSVTDNVRFRAVHDWHHVKYGHGFDFIGERGTYLTAIKSAPSHIHWLLFSEILLQASACIVTGKFQPQKTVVTNLVGRLV